MISHDHEVMYIHIPKCAGTSVETLFQNISGHHYQCNWYKQRFPEEWDAYYTFSIVRNTWDWYLSLHRYWMNCSQAQWYGVKDNPRQKMKAQRWYRTWVRSFHDAVLRHRFLFRSKRTGSHFWRQSGFIYRNSQLTVDYVAHMDTLTSDFEEIKVEAQLPDGMVLPFNNRLNDRDDHHYSAWYSDEMAATIGKFYARDIHLFGFEFERKEEYNPKLANTPFLTTLPPKEAKGCGQGDIIKPTPEESKKYGKGKRA